MNSSLFRIKGGFSQETVEILREIYGPETEAVIEALKTPGSDFCIRVNTLKTSREEVITALEQEGLHPSSHPVVNEAVLLPISGPHKLPDGRFREVIVDKNTAEAVLRGANVYAPGIQRCDKLREGESVSILTPNGERIATGRAKMNQTQILSEQRGLAIAVEYSRYKLFDFRGHRFYEEGLVYPQTLPSLLVGLNLKPEHGETIVDMNAAPGGKVSHIAQMLPDDGRIIAFDRHAEKVRRLEQNLKRLGIKNVETKVSDSRYLDKDFPTLKADAVLVDPPCSALGVRPKIYDLTSRRKVKIVAEYQRQFLEAAARILKAEGRILYSTCTMTLEENEKQVGLVSEKYGLTAEKQDFVLGSQGLGDSVQAPLFQRFHPHKHDTLGFFTALLRKTKT